MTARTPGPWATDSLPSDPYIVYGGGIHGNGERRQICCTANGFFGCDESMANAEFIVRACNSHDALVTALENMLTLHDCWGGTMHPACAVARAALAAAKAPI